MPRPLTAVLVLSAALALSAVHAQQVPLNATGGNTAGSEFTRLDATGAALPTSATSWSCVRDNVTHRVWEVKTAANRGYTYTWYDGSSGDQGDTSTCGNALGGNYCNTQNYVAAVNDAQLCGFSDWRLPTRRELLSIADYVKSAPAIDTDRFPNTESVNYWSADTYAPNPANAWVVYFLDGSAFAGRKGFANYVRLVRGGK